MDSVYWAAGAVTGMVDKTPKTWGGRIALFGNENTFNLKLSGNKVYFIIF